MFILVFPDRETFSPLDGCLIADVPDGLQADDVEGLLAASSEEQVATLRSYAQGPEPPERLIFLDDGGSSSRWTLASDAIVRGVSDAGTSRSGPEDRTASGRCERVCRELREAEADLHCAAALIAELFGDGDDAMSRSESRTLFAALTAVNSAHEEAKRSYEAAWGRFLSSPPDASSEAQRFGASAGAVEDDPREAS